MDWVQNPNHVSNYVCRTHYNIITKDLKILGLGTNVGDKVTNLRSALEMILQQNMPIIAVSSVYATPPWGDKEQDDFLNIVIEVSFDGTPRELLEKVLQIEIDMGRVRLRKWGPRLIDIDIIEFDGQIIDEEGLQLPHPYYPKRVFVVAPFAELYPDWVPTGGQETLASLMSQMENEELKRLPDVTL